MEHKYPVWIDNVPRSHSILNKNPSARCGILFYELLDTEIPEALKEYRLLITPELEAKNLLLKVQETE